MQSLRDMLDVHLSFSFFLLSAELGVCASMACAGFLVMVDIRELVSAVRWEGRGVCGLRKW